ncbi:MAG: TetR/AcrR family transcriptional regulator [Clostridia bacterium]|nr:TetR/AcrR family transcriptional regulator [Clostridia bacterium]
MPPKAKFTREEVINVAFDIVEQDGMDALTARSLAQKLGSSPRPIFTVFDNMEEVQREVIASANKLYGSYVEAGLEEEMPFKGVGKAYIRFAAEKSKLFQLLFMSEQSQIPGMNSVLGIIEGSYDKILNSIVQGYGFDKQTATGFYLHLWIYSHGIASLIATKVCAFTAEEIESMLAEVGGSIVRKIKAEGK